MLHEILSLQHLFARFVGELFPPCETYNPHTSIAQHPSEDEKRSSATEMPCEIVESYLQSLLGADSSAVDVKELHRDIREALAHLSEEKFYTIICKELIKYLQKV